MAEKISNLFSFWVAGLLLLCPAFFRQIFREKTNYIVLNVDGDSCTAEHFVDTIETPVTTKSFNIDNDIDKASLVEFILNQQKNNPGLFLCLPNNIVLHRHLSLPAAVKPDIRQALAFEINRKTPFTEDQVYFDFEFIELNNKLSIQLYIAPKEKVSSILERYQSLNFSFNAISTKNEKNSLANINFIDNDSNNNKRSKTNKLTTFLLLTATTLFVSLLYLPLYTQSQGLNVIETEISKKRKQAVQLQSLKKEKDVIFEQSHFLANKRAEQISTIEVINEVTRAIPNDTWLNRLVIKSGVIQLQGESSNASSLLQVIESSDLFSNAEFRSPITKNNQTRKDRFNLSANITKEKSI
jgi:general secretion pathway protein L